MSHHATLSDETTCQQPAGNENSRTNNTEPPVEPSTSKTQRDAQGRFAKGNRLSTGNPHARHCARMLEMFRNAITDDEMFQLCRLLFEKARGGDLGALKMIWQYKIGKPTAAPNPDMIERDEWNNYQTDVMTLDEVKQVLAGLPSSVGNAVVSTTRPQLNKAFSNYLLDQLLQSLNNDPGVPEGTGEEHVESKKETKPETAGTAGAVSHGEFGPTASDTPAVVASPATRHAAPDTTPEPAEAVSHGDFGPPEGDIPGAGDTPANHHQPLTQSPRSTIPDARPTTHAVSNGNPDAAEVQNGVPLTGQKKSRAEKRKVRRARSAPQSQARAAK
jgi:hypothetical protein